MPRLDFTLAQNRTMSIKHSLSLSLLLSSYASRTYSVTGRVAISLIHETTRAKRRRSIIFIFLPTAHSAWFVRGPNETLPSYSLYSPPPPAASPSLFSTEISMPSARASEKRERRFRCTGRATHQDAARGPTLPTTVPFSRMETTRFSSAKRAAPRPISFYAASTG